MQHTARHRHHGVQWRCGFCDKVFRTEAFLDKHMDNHHQNETHPVSTVCVTGAAAATAGNCIYADNA